MRRIIVFTLCIVFLSLQACNFSYSLTPSLPDYIRTQQLKYIERSFGNYEVGCFTEKDYTRFKKELKTYESTIKSEKKFYDILMKIKGMDESRRNEVYKKALYVYTPTWGNLGYIGSAGQTFAGQKAEKELGSLIVSDVKKLIKNKLVKPASSSSWKLAWSDEFNQDDGSRPDFKNWGYQTGDHGWGNNELENYTDDIKNSYIQNGKLVISALDESQGDHKSYTSARLVTKNKVSWNGGKIEVRAKVPQGKGIWPAIWLMPENDTYGSYEKNGELDIMEFIGDEKDSIHGSIHYYNEGDFRTNSSTLRKKGYDFSSDYHTYGITWGKTWIRWYLDGEPYGSYRVSKVFKDPEYKPFSQNFYMILNVAVGGNWPGSPDENTKFPSNMLVDYVRVYK